MEGYVFWITGLIGSGKSAIGSALYGKLRANEKNVVLLDGGLIHDVVGKDGFTPDSRKARAFSYAKLCKVISDQGINVVCCTISMFDDVRKWSRHNIPNYVEVYLDVPQDILIQRDVGKIHSTRAGNLVGFDQEAELPKTPDITIKNDDTASPDACADLILSHIKPNESGAWSDSAYWNSYYVKRKAPDQPSPFAQFVMPQLQKGDTLVDLGCGNGRDSAFFHNNGIHVTAIDSASVALACLREKIPVGINCILDDFTESEMLKTHQYDHCYSRFTMHSLQPPQQGQMIRSVYNALKPGGKFWIEVRGIYDTIYGKGEQVGPHAFIYEDHYRRFLVLDELLEELGAAGFSIEMAKEEKGCAPYKGDDPKIIRVIAKKG